MVVNKFVIFILTFYIPFATSKIASSPKSNNNLSCYSCSTIDDPTCRELNESVADIRKIGVHECDVTETYCLVTKVEYITGDTKTHTFWGLDRSCSKNCMEGCILIGERTRLQLCRSCCTTNLCNVNNKSTDHYSNVNLTLPLLLFVFLFSRIKL